MTAAGVRAASDGFLLEDLADDAHDFVHMRTICDERRRDDTCIASEFHMQAFVAAIPRKRK